MMPRVEAECAVRVQQESADWGMHSMLHKSFVHVLIGSPLQRARHDISL